MAFTNTWNASYEGDPGDPDNASAGAAEIRGLKVDVRERMAIDHSWAGDADDGKHKAIRMLLQSTLTAVPAGEILMAGFDPGTGKTEVFLKDEDEDLMQLSQGGFIGNIRGLTSWTASTTYTVETYTRGALVLVVGGGGGGGGADQGAESSHAAGGGGGGGGAALAYVDLRGVSSVTVTIGTGGAAGAAAGGDGGAGVASSFGTYATGGGGAAGKGMVGSLGDNTAAGGAPGGGSGTGAVIMEGGWGGDGYVIDTNESITSGVGGHSVVGGGGQARRTQFAGTAGELYGGGGSGGLARTNDQGGGAGADGIVIILKLG